MGPQYKGLKGMTRACGYTILYMEPEDIVLLLVQASVRTQCQNGGKELSRSMQEQWCFFAKSSVKRLPRFATICGCLRS